MNLREELFNNQDLKYREFHKNLIPNVDDEEFIGVRIPILRKIAKVAFKEKCENLCYYYEEKMVKGFTIGLQKCSVQQHIEDLKNFVPLINNWAVCDCCCSSFKFVKNDKDKYYDFIISYFGKSEYESRFAVVMLMDYYIDDEYIDKTLDILSKTDTDFYYVNMATAWALSVAFVKYKEKVLNLLKSKTLTKTVQNMTIQKIRESNRVSKEDKELVKAFKVL